MVVDNTAACAELRESDRNCKKCSLNIQKLSSYRFFQCMSHTWYLSIDFQLFLISPFLIYPAWKYGWKYLWTLPTLALLSCIYLFVMTLVFDIWLAGGREVAASFDFFLTWIYYPTHGKSQFFFKTKFNME